MHIEICKAGVTRGPAHFLKEDSATYIVQRKGKISFLPGHRQISDNEVKLGHIVVGSGGAKLEALQPLYVLPGRAQADSRSKDLQGDKYRLEPASSDRVEIILLRDGDVITSPDAMDSLICINRAPKVQVHSSATEQAKDKLPQEFQGVQEAPEDETEDEAAPIGTMTEVPVTQTVTQPSKSQPSATPHLPRDRSLVVAETPTTSRVVGVNEYEAVAPDDSHESAPVPQEVVAVTEKFSTARTGHSPTDSAKNSTYIRPATEPKRPQSSPEVRVDSRRGKKRAGTESSSDRGSKSSAEDPLTKRVKRTSLDEAGGDDDQNNLSDIVNADKNRIVYSTKRKSRTQLVSDATPTKSSRSSQRSGTATTAAAYEGDPPQVATSNSAIKESSSAVKFLRKHGGSYLADVDEKCNVLCVRDGGLVKTMKIFQAIALGIPIVTDKWLLDSAKADGFLDLSSYKPSVDQQEKEWNFSLEKVWGISQTPFKGYCIYFTPALRKTYTNFREIERVCQTVGAEVTNKRANKNKKTIVLATGEDDPETAKMADAGEACYYKDLVTTSILRGKVDLDGNEFKVGTKEAALSRRRGSRKST